MGESTKTHVLALFMLPFIRDLISRPVPAFFINKPMPSAGSWIISPAWRNLSSTGNQDDADVIKGFIKEIGFDKPFKTGELFDQTYDDSFGKIYIDVPLRGRDGHFEVRAGKVTWLQEGEALRPSRMGRTVKLRPKAKQGIRSSIGLCRYERRGQYAQLAAPFITSRKQSRSGPYRAVSHLILQAV